MKPSTKELLVDMKDLLVDLLCVIVLAVVLWFVNKDLFTSDVGLGKAKQVTTSVTYIPLQPTQLSSIVVPYRKIEKHEALPTVSSIVYTILFALVIFSTIGQFYRSVSARYNRQALKNLKKEKSDGPL